MKNHIVVKYANVFFGNVMHYFIFKIDVPFIDDKRKTISKWFFLPLANDKTFTKHLMNFDARPFTLFIVCRRFTGVVKFIAHNMAYKMCTVVNIIVNILTITNVFDILSHKF